MPRIHLWSPDWLDRRRRLERPDLNQSRLYNQALIAELDGPEAVYLCDGCGQRAAKLYRAEPPPHDGDEPRIESA